MNLARSKLLYVSFIDLGLKETAGIRKKVFSQIRTLSKSGTVDVSFICIENGRLISSIHFFDGKIHHSIIKLSYLIDKWMKDNRYEYAYIRLSALSLGLLKILKNLSAVRTKIYLEIPTYPFFMEDVCNLKMKLKQRQMKKAFLISRKIIKDKVCSVLAKRYLSGIVTYSKDSSIWGVKTVRISNGIDIKKFEKGEKKNNGELRLICVSSCVYWHGYDRVIEGLKNYYEGQPKRKVLLDIVGEGLESENYRTLIEKYGLTECVFLHGQKIEEELEELYKNADVALDSMGRHRVGVSYNSTLKGKEYMERGLPIVSGVSTELDYLPKYPYYMRVPADDTPVDIESILNFFDSISADPEYQNKIHAFAAEHFNYETAMKNILELIV